MYRLLLFCALPWLAAAAPPGIDTDAAREVGMDPAKLEAIGARMAEFADEPSAAGYVTLVSRRGRLVWLDAAGLRDVDSGAAMTEDAIFQIASMTKPITATAVMMLAEEGRLSTADLVETYLPEFRGQRMVLSRDGDEVTMGPPTRKITLRDLLTHTSGMGGGFPTALQEIFRTRDRTLAEAVAVYSQQPLEFPPGTEWRYSNMGIATLGRIVEVVSGMPFEDFLAQRIFGPLGMKDTFFFPPEAKHGRIAPIHRVADGELENTGSDIYRRGARYPAPEGGLYSTARDLVRFYQMFLNGGELDGARIVSSSTVEVMTRNHTGEIEAGFAPGMGFGYGWTVVRNVDGVFRGNSIGTYGHGGAYRTYAFVDPEKELIGVILFQKEGGGGDLAQEISAFIQMANAAVLD